MPARSIAITKGDWAAVPVANFYNIISTICLSSCKVPYTLASWDHYMRPAFL